MYDQRKNHKSYDNRIINNPRHTKLGPNFLSNARGTRSMGRADQQHQRTRTIHRRSVGRGNDFPQKQLISRMAIRSSAGSIDSENMTSRLPLHRVRPDRTSLDSGLQYDKQSKHNVTGPCSRMRFFSPLGTVSQGSHTGVHDAFVRLLGWGLGRGIRNSRPRVMGHHVAFDIPRQWNDMKVATQGRPNSCVFTLAV